MMIRTFVRVLACIFFSLYLPIRIYAVGEFIADYDVQYSVSPAGMTIVTQHVILTNLQSQLYPEKYSIIIDSNNIRNVIAYDDGGVITPEISLGTEKTEILLPFNKQVVGLGKQLNFTLRYENGDVASQNGIIWEINIPGVYDDPDIRTYDVSLQVPQSFGPNAYLSPLPTSGRKWNKEQMTHGGISAAYGTHQSFDVTLTYHIENVSLITRETSITLPPSTAYQAVTVKSLEPEPKNVISDQDGNWIASYELGAGVRSDITASVQIDTYITPREDYETTVPDKSTYIHPQKYWQSDASSIASIAQKNKTPRQIYEYVVNMLSYNYDLVGTATFRKGALAALDQQDQVLCTEFTDLFIAIARAAGIPARRNIGYAHTDNERLRPLSLVADVLHAWPEYYDEQKNLWIPVDPTWGDTTRGVNYFDKLDFNHLVFAINGISSERPYPAGFFRNADQVEKDITVEFSPVKQVYPPSNIEASFAFPDTITAGFGASGNVLLENNGPVPIEAVDIYVTIVPTDQTFTFSPLTLLPYAKQPLPLVIEKIPYWQQGDLLIETHVNNTVLTHRIPIRPTYWLIIPGILYIGVVIFCIILILKKRKIWLQKKHAEVKGVSQNP